MNLLDNSYPGVVRGYLIRFDEGYAGCAFSKRTKFGADMFVGRVLDGMGEVFRCSKDEIGLFIAVRCKQEIDGVWTHTHGEVETEFVLDKTTGETQCMITKYPLLSINYERQTPNQTGPDAVFIGV